MGFILPLPFLLRWAILFLLHQREHSVSNCILVELTTIASVEKRKPFQHQSPSHENKSYTTHGAVQGQSLSQENESDENRGADHVKAIITLLQEPYKKEKYAMFWESVIEFRRMVLCLLQLVYFEQVRLVLAVAVCAVSLIHHVAVYPYRSILANRTETFSLFLLLFVTVCNLIKCLMKDIIVYSSNTLDLYHILYSMELSMPIILTSFICGAEIIAKLIQRKKQM